MDFRSVNLPLQQKRNAQEIDTRVSTPRKKLRLAASDTSTPVDATLEESGSITPTTPPRRIAPKRRRKLRLDDYHWSVHDVLCESSRGGNRWVLVVWAGSDPDGKLWDHNYEPLSSLGNDLLRGWNLKKAAIQRIKDRKIREEAARRTIHWYLEDAGDHTIEYEEQLNSGALETSLLAQESPWFNPAEYYSPEVQKPTLSQLETAIGFESPLNGLIPEICLPPPSSHAKHSHLVPASQISINPYNSLNLDIEPEIEGNSEFDLGSDLQIPGTSVHNIEIPIIPDSQSFSEESDRGYRNSLGFTQSVKGSSLSTQEIPNTAYLEPGLRATDDSRLAELNDNASHTSSRNGAVGLHTYPRASKPQESSQDLDIGGFESQIPYFQSQVQPFEGDRRFALGSLSNPVDIGSIEITDSVTIDEAVAQKFQPESVDTQARSLLESVTIYPLTEPSQCPQSSSIARPPSKSPEILDHSFAPQSPLKPSSLTSNSLLEMSNPVQTSGMESYARKTQDMYGSALGSTHRTPSNSNNYTTSRDIYLPLPFGVGARTLYQGLIERNEKFLDDITYGVISMKSQEVLNRLNQLRTSLMNACTDIGLVDIKAWSDSQVLISDSTPIDYSTHVSSKCSFVEEFLLSVSHVEKHVCVCSSYPGLLDILESFLRANKLTFTRPEHTPTQIGSRGRLKVTLLHRNPTIPASSASVDESADLIIGLGGWESYDPIDANLKRLRQNLEGDSLCPLICLIVHHSIEHIWRWELLTSHTYSTTNAVFVARHNSSNAGALAPDDLSPTGLGRKVAELFLSDPSRLFELPSVFDLTFELVPPKQFGKPGEDTESDRNVREASASEALKRPIDVVSDFVFQTLAKRARKSPGDIVSVRDSQTALITQEDDSIVEAAATVEPLRAHLLQSQSLANELENELGKLQTRFEQQSIENHGLRTTLAGEQASNLAATTRVDELRAERTKLQKEITSLRQAMTGSTEDLIKRLGELLEKSDRADALQKKLKTAENDLDYLRQYYQKSSNAAEVQHQENEELKRENEELGRKANDVATKLRGMSVDAAVASFKDELKLRDTEKAHLERSLANAHQQIARLQAGLSINPPRQASGQPESELVLTTSQLQNTVEPSDSTSEDDSENEGASEIGSVINRIWSKA